MLTAHVELIDCQVSLHDPVYEGGQLEGVIDRALRAGVAHFVCVAGAEEQWPLVLDLTLEYPSMIPAFGLHPQQLDGCSSDWLRSLGLFLQGMPSVVGPIGLDMSLLAGHKQEQIETFRAQLDLARNLGRPAIIHNLGRWDRTIEMIQQHTIWPDGLLLFDYQGPLDTLEDLTNRGAYLCYTGSLLNLKPAKLTALLERIPLDRFLLASDSPQSMPPRSFAPYQHFNITSIPFNEPANLPHIVRGFAEVKGMETKDLGEILNHNALCLFGPLIQNEQ